MKGQLKMIELIILFTFFTYYKLSIIAIIAYYYLHQFWVSYIIMLIYRCTEVFIIVEMHWFTTVLLKKKRKTSRAEAKGNTNFVQINFIFQVYIGTEYLKKWMQKLEGH